MQTLTTDLVHDPFCTCRTTFQIVDFSERGPSCDLIDGPMPEPYLDAATGDTEYYWPNEVDSGRWDDDPNPYAGTYSEE